ncbi:LacI family DNA-binding transcriptional regulator [Polaromonas sp. YR568]|uniref:LacI family DNA-binding transcriptional regulator n=1 Tax=Polaromonas sp. YR568 TaxID=1855301 RepID=UPI0011135141|nr:LacI family DNA-binding transcriptional regulator [Polaromonas sp. YR568]
MNEQNMPALASDDTTGLPAGKRPRMADIARLAGVDVSTVSRALAGSPRVTKETRALIDKIVRDTGYVVNEAARNLRDGRANQVLVIVSDIAAPFYSDVVQGIVETLAERGINVLLGVTLRQAKREANLGQQLLTGVVDGIITVTGSVPEPILGMQGFDRKVVAISRPVPHEGVTCVTIDNYAAAKEVMAHLYAAGHRRIVHIGGPNHSETYRDRSAAYVDFMRDHGLVELTKVRSTDSFNDDAESGFEIMKAMLSDGLSPTAVFCATDELAISAMAAARQANQSIPGDVSFFGFDDLKLAGLMHPPLSTVSVPRFEMGRRGAEEIFRQIYKGAKTASKITLKHRLVLRGSVAQI